MYNDQIGARHHALESGQIINPQALIRPADIARNSAFVNSVRRVHMGRNNVVTFFFGQGQPSVVVRLVS